MIKLSADKLHEILRPIREHLEGIWQNYRYENDMPDTDIVSEGMCVMTSRTLLSLFNKLGHGDWYIEGGSPDFGAGYQPTGDEECYWHTWITNGELIIDMTADQFGMSSPEILIAEDNDPRFRTSEAARDDMRNYGVVESDMFLARMWAESILENLSLPELQADRHFEHGPDIR